jgi:hypothetical protein
MLIKEINWPPLNLKKNSLTTVAKICNILKSSYQYIEIIYTTKISLILQWIIHVCAYIYIYIYIYICLICQLHHHCLSLFFFNLNPSLKKDCIHLSNFNTIKESTHNWWPWWTIFYVFVYGLKWLMACKEHSCNAYVLDQTQRKVNLILAIVSVFFLFYKNKFIIH